MLLDIDRLAELREEGLKAAKAHTEKGGHTVAGMALIQRMDKSRAFVPDGVFASGITVLFRAFIRSEQVWVNRDYSEAL